MVESLGRFLGPAGYAVTYAWSISSSSSAAGYEWVNFRFVFHATSVILAICAVLAWPILTAENLMEREEENDVITSASSPPISRAGLGRSEQLEGSAYVDGSLISTGDLARRETDIA